MQVTETLSEGLKREFRVRVPASELDARLTAKLEEQKSTARIRGFRPGKVPVTYLRKLIGRQTMSDIVNELLNEQSQKIISDRGERASLRPTFTLTEDQKEAERVLDAKADLEYSIAYEALPTVTLGNFRDLAVERPVVKVPEEEVDRQLVALARNAASYTAKDGAAETNDQVTIDYLGKLDGVPFEGGADKDMKLALGSGQFIPGFEDQLAGVTAGEVRTIKVTFPQNYAAEHLRGREAEFEVTVKEVAAPDSIAIDDALAKKFGLDTADQLRDAVRRQIDSQYGPIARQRIKRQVLDALDGMHAFELPPKMVELEFENVWRQVMADLERNGRTFTDEGTTEEESRETYRKIAERRVRLGLVLGEIGERNKVEVTDQEMQRALQAEIRRNPGREGEVAAFYRDNANAQAQLRAPLYEEKVIDFILELAKVTDRPVTPEELAALIQADEDQLPGKVGRGVIGAGDEA